MSEDQLFEAYQKGFTQGTEHSDSSKETVDRISTIQKESDAKYMTKGAFRWFFGVQLTVTIIILGFMSSQVSALNKNVGDIKLDINSVKSDVTYLRRDIDYKPE